MARQQLKFVTDLVAENMNLIVSISHEKSNACWNATLSIGHLICVKCVFN